MRGWMKALIGLAVLTIGSGAAAAGPAASEVEPPSASRIAVETATFAHPWKAECTNESGVVSCGVPEILSVTVRTPATPSIAVVTVTFDYPLGSGDAGAMGLVVRRAGSGRTRQLPPGRYPLASLPDWTGTTLTWSKPFLSADTAYSFTLVGVASAPSDGDDRSILRGLRANMTVDVRPAGG
jgi:hypothetical protein